MTTKRKARKKAGTGQADGTKAKRDKKLIRLDDLIPKKDVTGGRQVLFGARDTHGSNSDDPKGR